MFRKLLVLFAMIGLGFATGSLDAANGDDVATFERLESRIQSQLPEGWAVARDVSQTRGPARDRCDDEALALVVSSIGKLPIETQFPGSAPGQEPFRESRRVTIVLAVRPYLTPEEFARRKAKDDELIKTREAAERKLRDIPWAYKGSSPVPPSAFRPRDEKERRRVLEYALMWNRAELEPLPTHSFEKLAFDVSFPFSESLVTDKAQAKQYKAIVKLVETTLKPYGDRH
jgi:hypothetical protein